MSKKTVSSFVPSVVLHIPVRSWSLYPLSFVKHRIERIMLLPPFPFLLPPFSLLNRRPSPTSESFPFTSWCPLSLGHPPTPSPCPSLTPDMKQDQSGDIDRACWCGSGIKGPKGRVTCSMEGLPSLVDYNQRGP